MIDFNKNKLINKVLQKYYITFSQTLDTCDYVSDKFNDKIHRYIYKNMKKKFREIDKEDRKHKLEMKRKQKRLLQKAKDTQDNKQSEFVKEKGDIKSETALCSPLDKRTSD